MPPSEGDVEGKGGFGSRSLGRIPGSHMAVANILLMTTKNI
jgi:hypothetical protein